jgi:alkylation response protein AidB-like acyl-CoA dehydrogenase
MSLADRFAELVAAAAPPLPAHGHTLQRWQRLAEVAAADVSLVKLYEGHTDALAILAELAEPADLAVTNSIGIGAEQRWATWAAEPPTARVSLRRNGDQVRLDGRKEWCSGAALVTHALVTAWDESGQQCLAAASLAQPGVQLTGDSWRAVGMGRTASVDVLFTSVEAVQIGRPGDYTGRPGFWHGGCGIAACWFGASLPLAEAVRAQVARRSEPHASAHLGRIEVSIRATRALLVEAAGWIDGHPGESARRLALQTRAAAEDNARLVLDHAGRALGAGPLCRDGEIAQRFADLPVFIRQSHAERDLDALGALSAATGDAGWAL